MDLLVIKDKLEHPAGNKPEYGMSKQTARALGIIV